MLRTVAVLFLLLGLATATPVVCLCVPPLVSDAVVARPFEAAGMPAPGSRGGTALGTDAEHPRATVAPTLDAASLISSSMAAAASLVATAAGLPSSAPWRLARSGSIIRLAHPTHRSPGGIAWSPAVPPPR